MVTPLEKSMPLAPLNFAQITEESLSGDEVHIWRIPLETDEKRIEAVAEALSPDERERAARFVRAQDQARFVAGRFAVRSIVARYAGLQPKECRFAYSQFGKPSLVNPSPAGRLEFNLSHSDQLALVAVTPVAPVGIDVERLRPIDVRGIAPSVFSASERKILEATAPSGQQAVFFALWARKEAYLKCLGLGLGSPIEPSSLTITGALTDLNVNPTLKSVGQDIFVGGIESAAGYFAAIAVHGRCLHVRQGEWVAER